MRLVRGVEHLANLETASRLDQARRQPPARADSADEEEPVRPQQASDRDTPLDSVRQTGRGERLLAQHAVKFSSLDGFDAGCLPKTDRQQIGEHGGPGGTLRRQHRQPHRRGGRGGGRRRCRECRRGQ